MGFNIILDLPSNFLKIIGNTRSSGMEAQTQKQLTHYESSTHTVPGRPGQQGSSHWLREIEENSGEVKECCGFYTVSGCLYLIFVSFTLLTHPCKQAYISRLMSYDCFRGLRPQGPCSLPERYVDLGVASCS